MGYIPKTSFPLPVHYDMEVVPVGIAALDAFAVLAEFGLLGVVVWFVGVTGEEEGT